ncbi:MAG: FxsA family protein [Gammaproteobacteria bacterium]|nr:FxsA family protein [Gammaproteobacteria bacterium]
MFPFIFILFIAVPIVEIAVLIKVGSALGVWTTIALVILTAVVGTMMLRAQSLSTLRSVQGKLDAGELPATQLLEGVALLIGGVLLLTPGFITDAFGFFCLLPPTRRWLISRVLAKSSILVMQGRRVDTKGRSTSETGQGAGPGVIDGEFRRED